jgi:hypothetical protein
MKDIALASYEEGELSQSHTSHEPAGDCGYLEDDDIEDL